MEKWTVRRATMKITDRGERDEIIGVEVTRERDQVREETRNKNKVEVGEAGRNEEKFQFDGILGTRRTLTIVRCPAKVSTFLEWSRDPYTKLACTLIALKLEPSFFPSTIYFSMFH